MPSRHYITAIRDECGGETEVRIGFVFHPYVPMRGPSYSSGGEPAEPACVEFDHAAIKSLGKWVDAPDLDEWAEEYLRNDGLDDAMSAAHDDRIAGEEYPAEMRRESAP